MENKFELIESYLNGEMSVKEQIQFEELLRKDLELMKEFLLRRDINDAIQEKDVIKLRSNLSEITKSSSSIKRKLSNPFLISSIAAIFLAFIIVSGIFITRNSDSKELYQVYYQKYPSIINARSNAESEKEKYFLNAFQAYEDNEFVKASNLFNELLKDDHSNSLLMFYISICELENNNLRKSEEYLNILILDKKHIFWEQAHWYLALNYLKQNKNLQAKEIFKIIIKENMSKKPESDKILKILN